MTISESPSSKPSSISSLENIEVGQVLKMHVQDTTPPKEKRFIVIGFSPDETLLATVYINSNINERINWSAEQQALQVEFNSDGRNYLNKKSYIDCSKLTERKTEDIGSVIDSNPEAIIGYLSEADYERIAEAIRSAPTIKGKYKKKYGLYD